MTVIAVGGLLSPLLPQATVYSVRPRDVHFHIIKADTEAEFWPRLQKDKIAEKTHVKLDWDRYVDEDEATGGFDTSDMGDAVRQTCADDRRSCGFAAWCDAGKRRAHVFPPTLSSCRRCCDCMSF